jgi:hypothetical protein
VKLLGYNSYLWIARCLGEIGGRRELAITFAMPGTCLNGRRIGDARSGILRHLQILRRMPGLHEPERHAIQDVPSELRALAREEVRFAVEKHGEAAKLAVCSATSIGPISSGPKASNVTERS